MITDISFGSSVRNAPLTGAAFKWQFEDSSDTFANYAEYRDSITKGGIASGPEKAKYFRNNKSKTLNKNGSFL